MRLPKLAIDNFQFTSIVFVIAIFAGISSYLQMPRTENPTMYIPGASVIVIYPGANPIDLERLVATEIEEALNELDDIKKINTTILDGVVNIGIEFTFDTDPHDKFDEVVEKVNSIESDLPDEIFSLDVTKWSSTDVAIMQLAILSENVEYAYLNKKAEELKKKLEQSYGIGSVDVLACPEQEVRVSIDMEKMAQMNISLSNVINAINSNNANIPGGSIDVGKKTFSIKTSGPIENLDELRNVVVGSYQGKIIYLKNIASVEFDYEDQNYKATMNSERGIFLALYQKEDLNIFTIMDGLRPILEDFSETLSEDIELETVFDQSVVVDDRIDGFMDNLIQGIILVGIVVLLALGFRSAILVIVAIPLSIIMGLFVVDLAELGMQQISIAGLVVALGLLVDNSIVMVENINRFLGLGFKPKEAAYKAASQIGWPIVSATATTVLAFVPIIMMPDKAGEFIRSLPVTIIATLMFSLIIALTLTPLIASLLLGRKMKKQKEVKKNIFERTLQKLIDGPYRKTLNFALKRKGLTLGIAIIVLVISAFMFQFVGVSFFPKAETPQFQIRITLPEGSNIDRTEEVTSKVEKILENTPDVKHYATNIGKGNPRIYYNLFQKQYAKNFSEIYVELYEYDVDKFDELVAELRIKFKKMPGAKINIKEYEQGTPMAAPIEIYAIGKDVEMLKSISKDIENMLVQSPGAVNIDNQLDKTKTDLYFNINRDKASLLGVPIYEIDKTIRVAVNGMTIDEYRDNEGEEYNVVLRLPVDEKTKLEDLDKIYITSMTGKQIPLKQLASLEFQSAPSIITHYNLERNATITADVKKGFTLDEVMNPIIKELDNYPFPPGYSYYIAGELESRQETFGGLGRAIVIAIIAIFAVLVLQFNSLTQPLIIYAAIPFAIIGMIWALLITGNTFSFTAFIGLISLMGIVINNSIILVDYSNQLRKDGKSLIEAVKLSAETRFTPIVLTSLTTIGGLLPLTIAGGTMWAPLGWTIIGGLFVSTFLTLIIVPILYMLLSEEALENFTAVANKVKHEHRRIFR